MQHSLKEQDDYSNDRKTLFNSDVIAAATMNYSFEENELPRLT
jgi:hypothetical protein